MGDDYYAEIMWNYNNIIDNSKQIEDLKKRVQDLETIVGFLQDQIIHLHKLEAEWEELTADLEGNDNLTRVEDQER